MNVRVLSSRPLIYTHAADPDDDRPPHVRAGSALAAHGDTLYVVQDDASFIARIRGDEVTAIPLPMGPGGRRRFEAALGNKLDKLDLESCVMIGDELWAFGSGSLENREVWVRMSVDGDVRIDDARALYARLRKALRPPINIEGVARVGDELWFCHRGNTGVGDSPAIVRTDLSFELLGTKRFDLGGVGFTDACALDGDRMMFLAAREASPNAIDDGRVLACAFGTIDRDFRVRIAPLVLGGVRKAEGIAMRGNTNHAWITVDPDDPDVPTQLYEVVFDGLAG